MKHARKNLSSIETILSSAGLLVITLTIGVFVSQPSTSATDTPSASASANAAVTIGEACSMTGSGMNSHSAEIPNGTYQDEIGTTTIKITCNDSAGFSVYAVGYTGDTIGETNSTKLVGRNTNSLISTSTTTSGDNSAWAMKLGTNGSATYAVSLQNGFGSYSAVPSSYTKVATRTAGTDVGTGATGSIITTTYASFISRTQPADTYDGKVKYTLVHPASADPGQQEIECDAGKICYSPNTSTSIGKMGNQSVSNNTEVTLWAPNFKHQGYGFAGWNTAYDYSGTNYGPNQDITTPSDIETNGLSLYAVWVPSNGTLQNWNGCNAMDVGDVTALTDNRDNDTYAVAKLADSKCWMIENLRLDNTPELSSTNTHNPSLPIVNIYDDNNPVTSNHLSAPVDPIQTEWAGDSDNQSMLATNNTTLFVNNNSSNYDASSDVYSYGNNYNWYSAAAGYRSYWTTTSNNSPATGDICPVGWHLMTSLDASKLNIAVNPYIYYHEASNRLRSYPVNFVYSGYVASNQYYNRGSINFYWHPSFTDNHLAKGFWLNDSDIYTDGSLHMRYGASVRCVSDV